MLKETTQKQLKTGQKINSDLLQLDKNNESKKTINTEKNKKFFVFTGGLGTHKRNFLENLSILLSAGMDVLSCLESVEEEFSSSRMRKFIKEMRERVEGGESLWRAFEYSRLFSPRIVSLIKIGEESGRLVQNINTLVEQQDKEWVFKTRIRTAMLYPAIVLPLTFFVGIGVAWFALPKMAETFAQLNAQLPLITRILMGIGEFLGKYGAVFVPIVLFSFIIILYFLFSFPKTKAIGQVFISKMPIFRRLIREVELARLGYVLNGLLKSGIPITEALLSLQDTTTFYNYKKFYRYLSNSVEDGNSFKKCFESYKNSRILIPRPVQQMIVSGEESGKLSETLDRIGRAYEAKIDVSIKNISTLMEPILLIVIGLSVATVALAVFMPIYNLTQIM